MILPLFLLDNSEIKKCGFRGSHFLGYKFEENVSLSFYLSVNIKNT